MAAPEFITEDKVASFLDRRLWFRLAKLVKPHRTIAIGALILLLVAEILPLIQPTLLRDMIDGPLKNGNAKGMLPYLGLFIGILLSGAILEYLRALASQRLGLYIIHDLRVELFGKVQRFGLAYFHKTPVGRLMQRLGNDIDSLNSLFTEGLVELLGNVLLIVYAVAFMFWLDVRLAAASLVVLPFMIYVTSWFRIRVRQSNIKIRKLLAELNSGLQESLAGVPIIRIFGKSQVVADNFDRVNLNTRDAWHENVKYYALYFPNIFGLTEISLIALYLTGAWLYAGDRVSLGTLIAFSWYSGLFFRPLRELSDKITALQSALAAGERVFTLYDTEAALPDGKLDRPPKTTQMVFENVRFSYGTGDEILHGVNFTIKEGETLALVGATGSGKSTLLSLAARFHHPTGGRILFGENDFRDYRETALRESISLIPQDVHLFAESVAFNIALSPDFDLNRVQDVCRLVNAHLFIEAMPQGYLSALQQSGENLSAGQRQLIAFARALYQNPRMLLLDEATSSVDTDTEHLIQEALRRLFSQMTCLVVAHRLSTVKHATRILVVHKGEIREQGTHLELLAQKGLYHKLYQLQSLEEVQA